MQPKKRLGPLRNVTEVIHGWTSIYSPIRVRLECGHEVLAWSDNKAHCRICRDLQDQQGMMPVTGASLDAER